MFPNKLAELEYNKDILADDAALALGHLTVMVNVLETLSVSPLPTNSEIAGYITRLRIADNSFFAAILRLCSSVSLVNQLSREILQETKEKLQHD